MSVNEKGKETDMCKAWEEIKEEEREQGKEEVLAVKKTR